MRLGIHPPQGIKNWSAKHRQWLEALKMEQSAHQIVLSDYRNVMIQAEDRVKHLEKEIELHVQGSV